jgi:hypothetical protein
MRPMKASSRAAMGASVVAVGICGLSAACVQLRHQCRIVGPFGIAWSSKAGSLKRRHERTHCVI